MYKWYIQGTLGCYIQATLLWVFEILHPLNLALHLKLEYGILTTYLPKTNN